MSPSAVALNSASRSPAPAPQSLLLGFPQTHLMWRHVAVDLAKDHTVICPDLRGYGDSDKPVKSSEDTYAKRAMAADIVEVARSSAIRGSRWPGMTAVRWSPSGPVWTTPAWSLT